jgi:hypothetical protein
MYRGNSGRGGFDLDGHSGRSRHTGIGAALYIDRRRGSGGGSGRGSGALYIDAAGRGGHDQLIAGVLTFTFAFAFTLTLTVILAFAFAFVVVSVVLGLRFWVAGTADSGAAVPLAVQPLLAHARALYGRGQSLVAPPLGQCSRHAVGRRRRAAGSHGRSGSTGRSEGQSDGLCVGGGAGHLSQQRTSLCAGHGHTRAATAAVHLYRLSAGRRPIACTGTGTGTALLGVGSGTVCSTGRRTGSDDFAFARVVVAQSGAGMDAAGQRATALFAARRQSVCTGRAGFQPPVVQRVQCRATTRAVRHHTGRTGAHPTRTRTARSAGGAAVTGRFAPVAGHAAVKQTAARTTTAEHEHDTLAGRRSG